MPPPPPLPAGASGDGERREGRGGGGAVERGGWADVDDSNLISNEGEQWIFYIRNIKLVIFVGVPNFVLFSWSNLSNKI